MKIKDGLHRLKICFKVTENIKRFVYMHLMLGKKIHVVDTGVAGTETYLSDCLAGLGRSIEEVGSEEAHAEICGVLGLAHLTDNPLFRRSIVACMSEA